MEFDDLSNRVIGCALEVHKSLGPGLLESAYEICLAHELELQGLSCIRQRSVPVHYKGIDLDCGYKSDLVVENALVIELKSVESLTKVHEAQLLTYLKLSKIHTGLLINFNERLLMTGLKRFVL